MTPETIAVGWFMVCGGLLTLGVGLIRAALKDRNSR